MGRKAGQGERCRNGGGDEEAIKNEEVVREVLHGDV